MDKRKICGPFIKFVGMLLMTNVMFKKSCARDGTPDCTNVTQAEGGEKFIGRI